MKKAEMIIGSLYELKSKETLIGKAKEKKGMKVYINITLHNISYRSLVLNNHCLYFVTN